VTAPITITRVFTELVTAGDANSVHRLGIYADNGAKPGVLLLDAGTISTGTGNAGTVATGGVAGIYEITCSLALQPGLYWAAGCQQGVTTTLPIMRVITAPAQATLMTSTASVPGVGSSIMGVSASPYSGALPSTLVGVSYSTIGSATRMGFRVGP
jgi:hypothetical protein